MDLYILIALGEKRSFLVLFILISQYQCSLIATNIKIDFDLSIHFGSLMKTFGRAIHFRPWKKEKNM